MRFPDVAASVVHLLMDFLGDLNTAPALDVVFFVREIMETNPKLRPTILARLLDSFGTIRSSRVCTCALWIIGEYCTSAADISAALEVPPQLGVISRAGRQPFRLITNHCLGSLGCSCPRAYV